MTRQVFYVGPFSYPDGGAAARRIKGNINTIKMITSDIYVINGDSNNKSYSIDGVKILSVSERPNQGATLLNKIIKYSKIGSNTVSKIKKYSNPGDIVILYSGYTPYLIRLLLFCKKENLKLVFDCVEWYKPKRFFEYLFKPYYWNIEIAMRFLIKRCDHVICISKFLYNYYSIKNVNIELIPPTVNFKELPSKNYSPNLNRIRLIYSGNPGKNKDKLGEVITLIKKMSDKYELHIAGISGVDDDNIFYYGTVDHSSSINLVSKSDFSILFRPNNTTSKAGFSTKVVESMSCGTPVIANNTGDLSDYIIDGYNGYLFDGFSISDLSSKLKLIASDENINYYLMACNSKKTAKESFDFSKYKNSFIFLK